MTKRKFHVTCVGLDDFGRGIVRIEDKTLFVDDLLEGEEADIETIYEFGKIKEAKVIKRTKDSPDRVKPLCPYYPSCGGCQIMHLSYEKQLEYKSKKVKDLLHKFTHIDIDVPKTIGIENPSHFRNKVQKPVREDKKTHQIQTGFYKTNTHQLVYINECLVESELSNRITRTVLPLLKKYHYTPYDEDKVTGYIRHLLIKTSSDQKQALVTLVSTTDNLKGKTNFAKELIEQVNEVVGVVININKRHTNVILGEKDVPVFGYTHISDKIFNNSFLISTQSFYQTNSKQIETLYGKAIEFAQLKKTDRLLDAYCGTGTIGLSCADKVKSVLGVEINPSAVKDAIRNTKRNNISNARFLCDDATEYMMKAKDKFDVIIMDPPRKGSTKEFIEAAKNLRPRTIVYVSCDPVTLARDLNYFLDSFKIVSVQTIDMFPFSLHVETIVLLCLKK